MDPIRLRTGEVLRVRPIRPDDREGLAEAHARLSPRSQFQRYLAFKPRLTAGDVHYLVDVDAHDHVALVATPLDAPEQIVGCARFVRLAEDPRLAEWAIVVGDRYQRTGLGSAMMQRLIDAAIERGVTRFTATMLHDNVGAHQLVYRVAAGSPRWSGEDDVDEVEFDLVPTLAPAFAPALAA